MSVVRSVCGASAGDLRGRGGKKRGEIYTRVALRDFDAGAVVILGPCETRRIGRRYALHMVMGQIGN